MPSQPSQRQPSLEHAGRCVEASPDRLPNPGHPLALTFTNVIGRERELAEGRRLIQMTRLLTLTGAGGVGKTRLALEVARQARAAYPDGVWFIELAPLADGALVPQTVARLLGAPDQPGRSPTDALTAWLGDKRVLLALDNCEHLLEACARLASSVLARCPNVRVLATSREALGVGAEVTWRVPSLAVPPPPQPSLEEALRSPAVQLFVARASRALPGFALTEADAGPVARVCQRLDGMPLAIELAAARVPLLTVAQIERRLDDAIRLLTGGGRDAPPRHRTLRATLDWSHALLTETEQVFLRRLAVFAGFWTLEAAEAVCAGEGIEPADALDLLGSLVAKSLAQVGQAGEARFRLLETVRQHAWERLRESGEVELVQRQHAAYYLALAEEAAPHLSGPRQEEWFDRLGEAHDNLRLVLRWAADRGDAETLLRLAVAIYVFWRLRGHVREAQGWLSQALAATGAPGPEATVAEKRLRGRALNAAATMARQQGDLDAARAYYEESLALLRAIDDRLGVANALRNVAQMRVRQGDPAGARPLLEESRALSQEVGYATGVGDASAWLARLALQEGDVRAARGHIERALAIERRTVQPFERAAWLHTLALVALGQGDLATARASYAECLPIAARMNARWGLAHMLAGRAAVAAAEGQPERALRLAGAAEALREADGFVLQLYATSVTTPFLVQAEAALGQRAGATRAAGQALPLEQALTEALDEEAATPPGDGEPMARAATALPCGLTTREAEALRLLARGATNRQIAAELSISVKTVNKHVASILGKTNSPNRTAAAAFALQHGLA